MVFFVSDYNILDFIPWEMNIHICGPSSYPFFIQQPNFIGRKYSGGALWLNHWVSRNPSADLLKYLHLMSACPWPNTISINNFLAYCYVYVGCLYDLGRSDVELIRDNKSVHVVPIDIGMAQESVKCL